MKTSSHYSFVPALLTSLLALLPLTSMAAPPNTGVEGMAFAYISNGTGTEIAPGLWVGPPSVHFPVATSFTVVSNPNGREVARVTTDMSGNYSLSLRPGTYTFVPDPITIAPGCVIETAPVEVTVRARELTPKNIFYFRLGFCPIIATP